VRILVVYQREPHARQMAFGDVAQPTTFCERVSLAAKAMAEMQLSADVWVDDLGDQSRALFGDLPHSAIVINPAGVVQHKFSWCDPETVSDALQETATSAQLLRIAAWLADRSTAIAEVAIPRLLSARKRAVSFLLRGVATTSRG
jgi:hypothetical protein